METKIRVQITRKLIDWALQQTSTQCAIALALKDAGNGDIVRPIVTQKTIAFTDARSGLRYTYFTPDKIATWIDTFDRDPSSVKPLVFTLDTSQPDRVSEHKPRTISQSLRSHEAYVASRQKVMPAKPPRIHRALRPA